MDSKWFKMLSKLDKGKTETFELDDKRNDENALILNTRYEIDRIYM